MPIEYVKPMEIEKRSFQIISEMLKQNDLDKLIDAKNESVVKRCIHTSADFDYVKNLYFSDNVIDIIASALKNGCDIVTDTQMAKSGINKKVLSNFGGQVYCFISDDDVAEDAKQAEQTRAFMSMEKAIKMRKPIIYAIGNAPTALIKLYEAITNGYKPQAVIAVPVGFVNVVESKELIIKSQIPCIVAKGRKGGSNIAAAICNAILYGVKADCENDN